MRFSIHQIRYISKNIRECGFAYTIREIFAHYGLLRRYPINQFQYTTWEKADKVKRIKENVVNYKDFISPNGEIIEFSSELIMNLKNGIKIYVRPQLAFNGDVHAIYETMLRQDYGTAIPGETVVDVGAYIGDFTILASSAGATVYAFEPSPKSFEQLRKNIKLMSLTNVKVFNAAVVPPEYTNRCVALACNDNNQGSTQLVLMPGGKSDVQCVSLKEFFTNCKIEKCDLLKLDCEGSEYKILDSLESDVYSKIRKIILEFHCGSPKRLEHLRRKLESEGFLVETVISPYSRVQGLLRCWK